MIKMIATVLSAALLMAAAAAGNMLPAKLAAAAKKQLPVPTFNPVFDSGRFVSTIDNPYFPLKPGTTTTYAGLAEGCSAREVFRVTTERKIILGVVTTVVHDSR